MTPARRPPPRLDLDRLECRAAPAGDLDPTFGTGGKVLFPPGDLGGIADVAVLADGRIVLAEAPSAPVHNPVDVIRLTAVGAADPTFGDGGRAVIDFGGPVGGGGVAVLPGGAVLVGTGVPGGVSVARLTPAGIPDPAFGAGGRAAVVAPGWGMIVRAVLVQPDGRIVLTGEGGDAARRGVQVRRLTADGRPDPAFGDGGRANFDLGSVGSAVAGGALQPDGRIVLVGDGRRSDPLGSQFLALRLTPAGALDPTFGTGGVAAVDFEFADGVRGVAVQPDGRIVLAGSALPPFELDRDHDFAVARLTPDGALDPSFGTGGRAWVDAGGSERASGVAVQPDGGIIISGSSSPHTPPDPGAPRTDIPAARLTADGKPDARFGVNGVAVVEDTPGGIGPMALQPDGRVILSGFADGGFGLTRLTADPPAAARGAVLVGGAGGYAALLNPAAGGYAPAGAVALDPGSVGPVRVAAADLTGDGVPEYIGGSGPGLVTRVTVRDGKTAAVLATVQPFEGGFTGGVYVAAADLTGDGEAEVVVTPDQGGGPVVAVYDGAALAAGRAGDAAQIARYLGIEDAAFRGGARPAAGDLTGDGTADVVVAAGFLGGPRVTIWDGKSVLAGVPAAAANFFAFEDTLRNGTFVAVGDVTGDGRADLAFGGGPGGGPRVRLFDGKLLLAAAPFMTLDEVPAAQRANFFAGDPSLRGGVRLALRDADGDGKADLSAGSGEGEPSRVRVYLSPTLLAGPAPAPDQEIDPFGAVLPNGVFVG
jgi:uncharacterized delta-60 repeat protein